MGELGDYLRELRLDRDWTLRDVEERSGDISNAHLSQIETGRIERPSEAMLHELALLYEVDFADLAKRAGYDESVDDLDGMSRRAVISAALRAYDSEDPSDHHDLLRDLEERAILVRERKIKARSRQAGHK